MEFFVGLFVFGILGVPIVLLIVFINKVNTLTRRVEWLEQELLRLRSSLQPPVAVAKPAPVVEAIPPAPSAIAPSVAPPVTVQPSPQAKKPQQVVEPQRPSVAREEWESFVGGKLLNRIGALALIIGVGFFLKYAFDNNWITETMRVMIGCVAGLALLVLGARFHKKSLQVFAQGLIGAGIAILYLSVYASFNFYHLVSQLAAFTLMSAVTVIAFTQAFKYDSLAISVLGWAGGYLTPIMLSTGISNEAGLFSYIDILEAGLLAVVLVRERWMILELLTFAGTYFMFALWVQHDYTEDALLLTVLFLTLFWILFYLVDAFRTFYKIPSHPMRRLINLLNAGVFYLYLYSLVNPHHHDIMGLLTVAVAALYVVPIFLAHRNDPSGLALRDNVMTVVALLVIATSIQFSGFITVACWAGEAVILVWCAQRQQYRYLGVAALILFGIAVCKLFATSGALNYVSDGEFTLVFNNRFLAFAALAVAMGFSANAFRKIEIQARESSSAILHTCWCVLLFVLFTCETVDYFSLPMRLAMGGNAISIEFLRNMTLMCVWIFYSLPLVYVGLKADLQPVVISGLVLTAVAFVFAIMSGLSYEPIRDFSPVFNVRMLAFIIVLGGSIVTVRRLKSTGSMLNVTRVAYPILLISQVLLFLLLLSGETRDIFERQMFFQIGMRGNSYETYDTSSIENMKQLSLSSLWLLYGIALMIVGIWRRTRGIRVLAIIILGAAILKIFIYDLSFLQTLYRIFSFIGLGLILLAASYMYQRYKSLIFGEQEIVAGKEPMDIEDLNQ